MLLCVVHLLSFLPLHFSIYSSSLVPLVVRTLHVGVLWTMLQASHSPNLVYQALPVLGPISPEQLQVKEKKWVNNFIIRCKQFISPGIIF